MENIGLWLLAIVMGILAALIMALPTMLLWNYLMPDIFGLTEITFWQALWLNILCSILFKNSTTIK